MGQISYFHFGTRVGRCDATNRCYTSSHACDYFRREVAVLKIDGAAISFIGVVLCIDKGKGRVTQRRILPAACSVLCVSIAH